MNPALIMKLAELKSTFEREHPRFVMFLKDVFSNGISEGSVIEIKVTGPDGKEVTTNMKVKQSDLEMIEALKNLKM